MQILIALAVFVAAVSSTGPRSEPLLVRAVIDGATIDVAGVGRVRLLGIEAPKAGRGASARFGQDARERLTGLLLHRWVRLETDDGTVEGDSRHLAYVIREDGLFVNLVLVREGLVRIDARRRIARFDELRKAQAEAQSFRRGMWGATPRNGARDPRYTRSPKRSRRTPSSSRP
jgi:micrococcal nuclease